MTRIDTTDCENEPIRFPGAVLPHGALLVLSAGAGTIEAVSQSCANLLGFSPDQLICRSLNAIIDETAINGLLAVQSDGQRQLCTLSLNGREVRARAHQNESGQILIDIEPESGDATVSADMLLALRRGINALRKLSDLPTICEAAAALIRDVTGYDQVMIYRFDAAWNGEVLAEACAPKVDPYLGLNFPASDIPKQARDLFRNCGVRMIADVYSAPSPLVGRGEPRAIDLGGSSLRNVSPIHIQYLKNMGASATLVGSLVVEGRLWGLVSCQQKTGPKYFGPGARDVLGWACEDIAALLEATQTRKLREREHELAALRQTLVQRIRSTDFKSLMRGGDPEDLLNVVGADGFALLVGDQVQTCGRTPSEDRIKFLQRLRRKSETNPNLFASNALARDLGGDSSDGLAGALFVSAPQFPEVTMIWFRRERRHTVRWSGDPDHPHAPTPDGRLSPRTSFDQFIQEIAGTSLDWTPEELFSAMELAPLIEIELLRKERAFAKTVLNSSPDSTTILDAEGRIVATNSAWNRFAQANGAPELATRSIGLGYCGACGIGEGDIDRAEALAAKAGIEAVLRKEQGFFSIDYPCHSPTTKRWFRIRVYPMLPPAEGVVIAHDDVTGKILELKLWESQKRFQALYEAGLVGIMSLALTGQVTDANNKLLEMLGYAREDLDGGLINWMNCTPPEYHEITRRSIEELKSFGVNRQPYETAYIRKDETHIPVLVAIVMLDDMNGVAFVLDLTEQKRAAERSRLLYSERVEIMKSMAAGLAHELNQPLTATQSFLGSARELLKMEPDRRPATVEKTLENAASHVARAGRILVRLREFIANSEPDKSFFNLHDLIREATDTVSPKAQQRGIEVSLQPNATDDEILADPVQIGQVLVNLLQNAKEAIGDGTKRSIIISTSSTETHIEVDVADTGIGISGSVGNSLFEPFVSSKATGMGVGLVISRAIIESHEGKLNACSNLEGGATFSFTLPLASGLPLDDIA